MPGPGAKLLSHIYSSTGQQPFMSSCWLVGTRTRPWAQFLILLSFHHRAPRRVSKPQAPDLAWTQPFLSKHPPFLSKIFTWAIQYAHFSLSGSSLYRWKDWKNGDTGSWVYCGSGLGKVGCCAHTWRGLRQPCMLELTEMVLPRAFSKKLEACR